MNDFSFRLPQNRRVFHRLAWGLCGLLTAWLLAWALVPVWAQSELQNRASAALGRRVTVGAVDFRPWAMELRVHDLTVARADGTQAQLQIGLTSVNVSFESLFRLAPVLDAVTLEEPRLFLERTAPGRYDIDDVLEKLMGGGASTPPEASLGFALYNIGLRLGSVDFNDRPAGRTHSVRELNLAIPFLSNLESKRDVYTAPHLSFKLNGAAFDSAAQSLPFAHTHKTDVELHLQGFDLAPYLPYLPLTAPVQVQAAVIDADLRLSFEQAARAQLKLSGTIQVRRGRLGTGPAQGPVQELLRFESLTLGLDDVQPLARRVKLSKLEWVAPQLRVHRGASGRMNFEASATPGAGKPGLPPDAAPTAWQVSLAQLVLRDAQLEWQDDSTTAAGRGPARMNITGLNASASAVAWPMTTPFEFSGQGVMSRTGQGLSAPAGDVSFSGQASARSAQLRIGLARWPLNLAAPYLATVLEPELSGQVEGDFTLQWQAASTAEPGTLVLGVPQLRADQLRLIQGTDAVASVGRLDWQGASVDLLRHQASWDLLAMVKPSLMVQRTPEGRWMFDDWLRTPTSPGAAPATGSAWHVTAKNTQLTEGNVSLLDRTPQRPVRLTLSQWQFRVQDFDNQSGSKAVLRTSAQVSSSARVEPGSLAFGGQLVGQPLAVQGKLDLKRFPLHALGPYAERFWQAELLRADTSVDGDLRYALTPQGSAVWFKGNSAVEDLRLHARRAPDQAAGNGEELLNCKLLSSRGVEFALAPQQATRVEVQETVLSDFFAHLVVNADGRFNLQDALSTVPAPASTEPANAAVVKLGPTTLLGGRIDFSDHFIKPNYSAQLSELTGRLGALSSMAAPSDATAALELRGRAQGTASLEITGQLNPLARPPTLDINGKVRDLELPPLSPYAIKYAGHGIERGKLSVDVAYTVLPDGQLTAKNQLILNQLRFGAAVDGAPTQLPVALAVALLADRNGVIDIQLPVSGSLNDPQFSLGPVIWKVLANLIGKALTSPFALLSATLGESSESLSTVPFDPGSAVLNDEGRQALNKLAGALLERPELTLSVVGTASLDVERNDYKRAQLRELVEGERRRARLSTPTASPAAPENATDEAAYARLLRTVYRRAEIQKPRNFLGLTKDIPTPEMENLLLVGIVADEQTMRTLAVQRAVAVKDYLAAGRVPVERLFLGSAKTVAPEAKWRPRAELRLELR